MEPRLPPPPPRPLPEPPLPPPALPHLSGVQVRPIVRRAGELTTGWRIVFIAGWVAVVLGIAAVWKASRIVGLSTWWLGPTAQPRLILISLIPFFVALLVVGVAVRNMRHLPWIGVLGAIALAGVALGDVGRFDGLALVELAVAAGALLISVASFAGVLHPPRPAAASTTTSAEADTPR